MCKNEYYFLFLGGNKNVGGRGEVLGDIAREAARFDDCKCCIVAYYSGVGIL